MYNQDLELQQQQQQQQQQILIDQNGADLRLGFLTKVFGLFSLQLLFLTFMIYYLQTYFKGDTFLGLFLFSICGQLVFGALVVCEISLARNYPFNYILFGILSFCELFPIAFIFTATTSIEPELVLFAGLLTCSLTLTLMICAIVHLSSSHCFC